MKQSIRDKLEHLASRLEELDRALAAETAAQDMNAFRELSRERAEIEPVVLLYRAYRQAEADCDTARELLDDPDMRELGEAELQAGEARIVELDGELQRALLPRDPNDERNLFLEIAQAPAVAGRRCSPPTCCCTRATPSASAGSWRSCRPANPTSAATK